MAVLPSSYYLLTTPPLSFNCSSVKFGKAMHRQLLFQPVHKNDLSILPRCFLDCCVFNSSKSWYPSFAATANTSSETCEEEQMESPAASDGSNLKGKDVPDKRDNHKMIRVCDKLVDVFLVDMPTATDWRRLLIFSKQWNDIRPHFYQRCQEKADCEGNPEMKHKLLRLRRKLKEIDEDVQRHNELFEAVREASSEIDDIVARRRKDFTTEFFMHVDTLAASYYDNPTEQKAVAKLANMCMASVQVYDTASESIEEPNAAKLELNDVLNSPFVDAACRNIDSLAEKNQLDSALGLMITKAWSDGKEVDMTIDEAQDTAYDMYITAVDDLQRQLPKEIRIIKYLLTIEDPEQKLSLLSDAFTPGEEIEGKYVDTLYTTPEKLHGEIKSILNDYHFSQEGQLIREARDLTDLKMVQKLEELQKIVEDKFL